MDAQTHDTTGTALTQQQAAYFAAQHTAARWAREVLALRVQRADSAVIAAAIVMRDSARKLSHAAADAYDAAQVA